jgi:uncharacterized lipoprotein YddW (UPF0748 family)
MANQGMSSPPFSQNNPTSGLKPFTPGSQTSSPPPVGSSPFSSSQAAPQLASLSPRSSAPSAPAPAPVPADGEFRAAWVTRFEWPTGDTEACKNKIKWLMTEIADANFNAVIFQVRGTGDVFYKSPIEPWAKTFNGQDPGVDFLQFALDEARKNNLEFHAWLNVYPIWQGTINPPDSTPEHPFYKYCDPSQPNNWLCYDKSGQPMTANAGADNYYFLSPGNPEVMDYIRRVMVDVASRYDVDGIHYDRVRYPGTQYSHDAVSKARFQGEGNPDGLSWNDWQRRQINDCLERIYAEVMSIKSDITITASVWGIYNKNEIPGYSRFSSGYHDYFQDSLQYAEEGCIDALIPMIYWAMNDDKKPDYDECLDYFTTQVSSRHVYGGLYSWKDVNQVFDALNYTRGVANSQGTTIFSWGKLVSNSQMPQIKSNVYGEKVKTPSLPWKMNPTKGIILGKVLSAADNSPVVDSLVTITETSKHRLSSADGTFAILEVDPGSYNLNAKKVGMNEGTAQVTVEAGKVATIDIKL